MTLLSNSEGNLSMMDNPKKKMVLQVGGCARGY